jgi:hypothetical protein
VSNFLCVTKKKSQKQKKWEKIVQKFPALAFLKHKKQKKKKKRERGDFCLKGKIRYGETGA